METSNLKLEISDEISCDSDDFYNQTNDKISDKQVPDSQDQFLAWSKAQYPNIELRQYENSD